MRISKSTARVPVISETSSARQPGKAAGGVSVMMSDDLSLLISGEEEDTDLSEAAVRRAFPRYDIGRILSQWYAIDIWQPGYLIGPARTITSLRWMLRYAEKVREAEDREAEAGL